MKHHRLIKTALAACAVTVGTTACDRREFVAPERQTTSGTEIRMEPMTVRGCLRAGNAEKTFVLMAENAEGAQETATFHLIGGTDMNFAEHVGRQVEVSGIVRTEEQIVSSSGSAAEQGATGTAGTPRVETKMELDVKRLEVRSVKPTGHRCAD